MSCRERRSNLSEKGSTTEVTEVTYGWPRSTTPNLQPSCAVPVVVLRRDDGSARVETMTWGLVPSWHAAGRPANHFAMFNARSETVRGLKSFSGPLRRKQRCLVLVNGFYEWRTETAVGKKVLAAARRSMPLWRMPRS